MILTATTNDLISVNITMKFNALFALAWASYFAPQSCTCRHLTESCSSVSSLIWMYVHCPNEYYYSLWSSLLDHCMACNEDNLISYTHIFCASPFCSIYSILLIVYLPSVCDQLESHPPRILGRLNIIVILTVNIYIIIL